MSKRRNYILPLIILLVITWLGCEQKRTPYHSGPVGPGPAFDPGKTPPKDSPQQPGVAPSPSGQGKQDQALSPPRITRPGENPAETFGTAAGRTFHPPKSNHSEQDNKVRAPSSSP